MFLNQFFDCSFNCRLKSKKYFLAVYISTVNDYFKDNSYKKEINRFSKILSLVYYATWLHYLSGNDCLDKSLHREEIIKHMIFRDHGKPCQEI